MEVIKTNHIVVDNYGKQYFEDMDSLNKKSNNLKYLVNNQSRLEEEDFNKLIEDYTVNLDADEELTSLKNIIESNAIYDASLRHKTTSIMKMYEYLMNTILEDLDYFSLPEEGKVLDTFKDSVDRLVVLTSYCLLQAGNFRHLIATYKDGNMRILNEFKNFLNTKGISTETEIVNYIVSLYDVCKGKVEETYLERNPDMRIAFEDAINDDELEDEDIATFDEADSEDSDNLRARLLGQLLIYEQYITATDVEDLLSGSLTPRGLYNRVKARAGR